MGCASTESDNGYDDSIIRSFRNGQGGTNYDEEEEDNKFKDFEEIGSNLIKYNNYFYYL